MRACSYHCFAHGLDFLGNFMAQMTEFLVNFLVNHFWVGMG